MITLALPDIPYEERLLERARSGDKDAITEIYRNYVDSIYQFCRLRLGNPQQAEDITSTVFTKLIQAIAGGKAPRYHLRGWLFKVARNAIYDSYGQQLPLPIETIEQWTDFGQLPLDTQIDTQRNSDVLRRTIQQLSPDQQEVILLRFDQQLSVQETADILGKKVNTVKALQFRAISRLRKLLIQAGVTSE